MRPALEIREILYQYQQKPQLIFSSGDVGLDREIKLQGESPIVIIDSSPSNSGCSR